MLILFTCTIFNQAFCARHRSADITQTHQIYVSIFNASLSRRCPLAFVWFPSSCNPLARSSGLFLHFLLRSFPCAISLHLYTLKPPDSHHLAPYALHLFTMYRLIPKISQNINKISMKYQNI